MKRRGAGLLCGLALLVACGGRSAVPDPPAAEAVARYEALYPDRVEICAMSRIRLHGEAEAQDPGRAALFLAGVCAQPGALPPQISRCEGGEGVGIAVDARFENADWVAVPGRAFFLRGRVEHGQPLTPEAVEATVAEAVSRGIFTGLKLRDESVSEEDVAREALARHYALAYGRSLLCAKLPVTAGMLTAAISELNTANVLVAAGQTRFRARRDPDRWLRTVGDALAQAGIFRRGSPNEVALRRGLGLAAPAARFVELAALGNEFPLEDARAIHADPLRRETLRRYGWLPGRHGALLETVPILQPNRVFDTPGEELDLGHPLLDFWAAEKLGRLDQTRLTSMDDNLGYFEARYRGILAERNPAAGDGTRLGDTLARYYAAIEAQLEDATRKRALRRGG